MTADPHPDLDTALDRRRALGLAAAAAGAAGAAWVAPAVLSVDAAGAATQQPPPLTGTIFGFALLCGHEPDPGTSVTYTGPVNGSAPASDQDGSFSIPNLPAGIYTIFNGGTDSGPVNLPAGGIVGPVTIDDLSGGC